METSGIMATPERSDDPVDHTNIDEVCAAWAQEKYGSKYKDVTVDTSKLKVTEENMSYSEKDKEERLSERRSTRTFVNRLNIPVEQEFSEQSTKKYTCVWTKNKGKQLSGGLSVNVGLPKAVGLSAKVGGHINLSETKTTTSGTDETSSQVTRLQQPPRSTLFTEITTKEKVVKMTYSLSFRLQGMVLFRLEKDKGTSKEKSVDVVELHQEFGGKVVTDAGEKRVLLTTDGNFEATTETSQVVKLKEPDPDTAMKMTHSDLLRDNREKIVEEVKDEPAMSRLLEVMSSEQLISEEQSENVSQNTSVKEGVNELVDVLQNVEPEKFLLFVDILQREGYSELVEPLDPRQIYPDNIKHISNLSGVVNHYFVTKKESEVKNSLQTARGAILHGMPGSGKTQMATKVAGDYARMHPHAVVWVLDGSSEEKLRDGIAKLQQKLGGETDDVDISMFQSLISRWKHCLLIINDKSPRVAIPHQLRTSSAKLIITTQDSFLCHEDNMEDVRSIPMEGFTEDEAVEFLSPQMPAETPTEHLKELANIFSCLPLGLAAARASIYRGSMTVVEYRLQLQGGRAALETLMDREDKWLRNHYKQEQQEAARNIFAALQLAIDRLDDQCSPGEEKKCKVMLQQCAFLEPNKIPVLILKAALTSCPTIGSEAHFTERMRMYSLGSIDGEGVKRRLSIHSVTQMALRLQLDKEQQTTTCINRLLQILVKFFSKDTMYAEMYKFSASLMPHVEAALKHADKLELGPEYPLMKARLLMVCGHLLVQKGTPALSETTLKEAKKLLLQFAGIHLDILTVNLGDEGIRSIYSNIIKELYQSLADKSQSLKDSFFQETVIRRVISKQHLRSVSNKFNAEDTRTLENMVENFEPLTTEMYMKLVDRKMAIPMETLKRIFLPELYISIIYTLGKALFDMEDRYKEDRQEVDIKNVLELYNREDFFSAQDQMCIALNMCFEVTNETGVIVMVHFLTTTDSLSRLITHKDVDHIIDLAIDGLALTYPRRRIHRRGPFSNMISNLMRFVDSLTMQGMMVKGAATQCYDFGLLTSGDIFTKLNFYENATKYCTIFAKHFSRRNETEHPISTGKETCKQMLELIESESQAGNPPLRLAAYYITAGQFKTVVRELEKAAEMFLKAYRVELKREEYHPRMEEALIGLNNIYIAQNELRRARVCARRRLQLAQDHWPESERVTAADKVLAKVCCKIAFRALKRNKKHPTA